MAFLDLELLQTLDIGLQFLLYFVSELLDEPQICVQRLLKNPMKEAADLGDHVPELVSVALDLLGDFVQTIRGHIELLEQRLKLSFAFIKRSELYWEVEEEFLGQLQIYRFGSFFFVCDLGSLDTVSMVKDL